MGNLSISESQLDKAYKWLCQQRKHYPPNADIWDFRFHWEEKKLKLLAEINSGNYLFSPLKHICKENGQFLHLFSSKDSLILKVLAAILSQSLSLPSSCTHIKGNGGLKHSVKKIDSQIRSYQFVCKTDVKSFYESIDQYLLYELICKQISDKDLRYYLWQVIHRTVESGGNYRDITHGIARGSPVSPILGALYLKELDDSFDKEGLFYLRYMDDIVILTKTRWHNRKAVRLLNNCFNRLKVKQHPDKTFIGKIERGFDFLGYHFSRKPLRLASITIRKHVEHFHRLYEQQKTKKATSEEMALVLGQYVKRWQRWCTAGLQGITYDFYDVLQRNQEVLSP